MIVEILKSALDEWSLKFPANVPRADTLQRIKVAVDDMSAKLVNLAQGGPPEYATPEAQFGYLQRYVVVRAQMIANLMSRPVLQEQFGAHSIQVTSLGGGPGTDLLGVLKGTMGQWAGAVTYYSVDQQAAWDATLQLIGRSIPQGRQVHLQHVTQPCNAASQFNPAAPWLRSRLFILSYSISEFIQHGNLGFVQRVLQQADAGSFVLFIDNYVPAHFFPFLSVAEAAGVLPEFFERWEFTLGAHLDEQGNTFAEYNLFGNMQTTARAAVFIGRKA